LGRKRRTWIAAVAGAMVLTGLWPRSGCASPAPQERRVSPRSSLLMSTVVPGWGQLANGHPVKAAACFAAGAGLVGRVFIETRRADEALRRAETAATNAEYLRHYGDYTEHFNRREDAIWWAIFFWLYVMVDAYVDAHLFGFDEEFKGEPSGEGLRPWIRANSTGLRLGFRFGV